jgi:hypothetical protein
MYDRCRGDNEAIGVLAREEAASFAGLSLADAECCACGEEFGEGESVVVYVFRRPEAVRYEVGRPVCGEDRDAVRREFTLGLRELVIAGRVGLCSDVARQASWLVLVAPRVVGVSAAATTAVSKPPESEESDAESSASPGDARRLRPHGVAGSEVGR